MAMLSILAIALALVASAAPLHSPVIPKGTAAPEGAASLCSPCVSLGDQGISTLLNYLLNAGVMGTCEKLCGSLPGKSEQLVCTLACEAVGMKAFVDALSHADLDPIYLCEAVHACTPGSDAASASITAVRATPASVAKGSTLQLECSVVVVNATGVGQFRIAVTGPVTDPISQSFLLPEGIPVGSRTLSVQLTPQDDESGDVPVTWQPGQYSFEFEVCQGECESKHPHSKVFGKTAGTFTLTETAQPAALQPPLGLHAQCQKDPYIFCCAVGSPCDCAKGTLSPGQCKPESYAFCCAVGAPCNCNQPPGVPNIVV